MKKTRELCRVVIYRSPQKKHETLCFKPYHSTTFICTHCAEKFVAREDELLHLNLKSTIQGRNCPTCQTPLRECLVKERIPDDVLIEKNGCPVRDEEMREKGYNSVFVKDDEWKEFYNIFS